MAEAHGTPRSSVLTPAATGIARLRAAFAAARAEGRPAFLPYVTIGHPERDTTDSVAPALAAAGADIIELGVPFSDPLADGVVVQRSTQRALANGITLSACFAAVARLRAAGLTTPLVFFGYMNPIEQRGVASFAAECARVGVDGVLVADLPAEEAGDLRAACEAHGVALIPLLAPTSTPERIAQVAEIATGFVYCVGVTGVTGAREALASDLAAYLARVREQVAAPLVVGFGISRPEHVAAIGAMADGVAVGSALVRRLEELPTAERAAGAAAFVRWLTGKDEGRRTKD